MNPESPPQSSNPRYYAPRLPRQRVNTTDLMAGSRELVLLREGEEYALRITKAGKLILTK
jgi:hemin uptake protein HemP